MLFSIARIWQGVYQRERAGAPRPCLRGQPPHHSPGVPNERCFSRIHGLLCCTRLTNSNDSQHNRDSASWRMGVTPFTDLTNGEFVRHHRTLTTAGHVSHVSVCRSSQAHSTLPHYPASPCPLQTCRRLSLSVRLVMYQHTMCHRRIVAGRTPH